MGGFWAVPSANIFRGYRPPSECCRHSPLYSVALSQVQAPATIATYVAAVSYMHKLQGWADPTRDFLVTKLLEGCRRDRPSTDPRLPVSLPMLAMIVHSLPVICTSLYEAKLVTAAFLTAFFGFMRIWEFAANSKRSIQPSVRSSTRVCSDIISP